MALLRAFIRAAVMTLFVHICTSAKTTLPSTCLPKYQGAEKNIHTMCMEDNPNAVAVTLTQKVKDAAVAAHNKIRASVMPTAANMQKMYWDEKLAAVAQKWSMQCPKGHDKNRSEPDYGNVGQNAASGYPSLVSAVVAWGTEVSRWKYGPNNKSSGHYHQEISALTIRVGCGQSKCNGSNVHMCNYFRLIQNIPYKEGDPCADCPNHCDSSGKLCDCGGKFCMNGGSLNLTRCECDCHPLWTGNNCTTMNCPLQDFLHWCSYPSFNATKSCPTHIYYRRNCPIACGVCDPPCEGKKCMNGGKLNVTTCQCTCKGRWMGENCTELPCGGKVCMNRGKLNETSCQCDCPRLWVGDQCKTKNCPTKDFEGHCSWSSFNASYHCRYPLYKDNCPIACGICDRRNQENTG